MKRRNKIVLLLSVLLTLILLACKDKHLNDEIIISRFFLRDSNTCNIISKKDISFMSAEVLKEIKNNCHLSTILKRECPDSNNLGTYEILFLIEGDTSAKAVEFSIDENANIKKQNKFFKNGLNTLDRGCDNHYIVFPKTTDFLYSNYSMAFVFKEEYTYMNVVFKNEKEQNTSRYCDSFFVMRDIKYIDRMLGESQK